MSKLEYYVLNSALNKTDISENVPNLEEGASLFIAPDTSLDLAVEAVTLLPDDCLLVLRGNPPPNYIPIALQDARS